MIRNIFIVFASNGIVAVVGLISSLFIPNILSIEDYAEYQTFLLYLGYVSLFHLGFPNGLSIKYAGKKIESIDKGQFKSEMLFLMFILSVFSSIVFLASFITKSQIIGYIAIMLFSYCFLNAVEQILQAFEKFVLYTICHILMSALPLLMPLLIYLIFKKINAQVCILSYVIIYTVLTFVLITCFFYVSGKWKSGSLLNKNNIETEKMGLYFHIGSYIGMLFHNIDKQFVQWFCMLQEYSFYSFSITMQSTMTIFLTAISQPLFPYLALENSSNTKKLIQIKRYLIMIGSLSGMAYFACSFIVEHWIQKYLGSLDIIRIYFAVFPAMAVVNCLYSNLYKIYRRKKRYILDLIIMLLLAAAMDSVAIWSGYSYIGVALATTILYYIWLIYGTFVFRDLKLNLRELIYLVAFFVIFGYVPSNFKGAEGMIIYFVLDMMIGLIFFPEEVKLVMNKLIKKF